MTRTTMQGAGFSTNLCRTAWRAAAIVAVLAGTAGMAQADCNSDFAGLMKKRMSEIDALNKISKGNKGKLDPIAACPRLRSLSAAEGEVVAYMVKNKDWCGLPDDLVSKMSASRARTASIATKACGFAAKMKEAQKQAAQGAPQQEQAVKLPTGPL